ncbi:hypothetical protein KJ937_03960 [Patescibacteria group bacterium]|nr:hypothetical protein [Patescibacteria group bacterium]MBU2508999.1 hypothetical protein [Patescibacteria group bacterium]
MVDEFRQGKDPGYGFYDPLTLPGACHRLVRQTLTRKMIVIEDLGASVSMHSPETIVLIQHEQCGGYAADQNIQFESTAHERRVLLEDIVASARILRGHFPQLTVLGFIARVDDKRILGMDRVFDSSNQHVTDQAQASV